MEVNAKGLLDLTDNLKNGLLAELRNVRIWEMGNEAEAEAEAIKTTVEELIGRVKAFQYFAAIHLIESSRGNVIWSQVIETLMKWV